MILKDEMNSHEKMIYLDSNATTIMPAEVLKAMLEWSNRGNPSAGYASARESRKMMVEFREHIAEICGISQCCEEERDVSESKVNALRKRQTDPSQYKIIFTSGASEANCTVIRGVVDAYINATGALPHIVVSAIEHKSIIEQVKWLVDHERAEVTWVQPVISGHILPKDIGAAIQPNTALVCVMHANNETGAINDIAEIGRIAHSKNVPFHCDTVQAFGKYPINPVKSNVDSFCISFHKLHGPPGVGALVIKQQFLQGYKIPPMIFGTQNDGVRGGTENLPGLGAASKAFEITMTGRPGKNAQMTKVKSYIMDELSKRIPTKTYVEYVKEAQQKGAKNEVEIVYLSGNNKYYLPNTILLSVVKRGGSRTKTVCNTRMKEALEKRGIIVSIGSACNTASPKASHVLYAMGADDLIRQGALRISVGDLSTVDDAKKFVMEFMQVIKAEINS